MAAQDELTPDQAGGEPGGRAAGQTQRRAQRREIIRLAVPALGALVAEPLFQLCDSAIVGHLGAAQLAGLGAAGAALATLVNVCIFLAYGTTSAVARRMGAGDLSGAVQQGVDGMWVALLLGAVIAAVSVPLAGPIAGAFGAAPTTTGFAVTYLRISAAGVPSMLLVLAGTGILRGLQDTRVPLLVAAVGAVVNVALNYLLVFPAGLGIAGSATGTVIVQTGMGVAYAAVAVRAARRHGAHLRPDWAGIRASAGASFALLVRTAALRVYLLIAVWIAARSGTAALAAHTVATNLWNTLALALDALAIAAQALVGHALGAGDVTGARAATARMCWWGLWLGVIVGALVAVARPLYVPLFTPDHAVQVLLSGILLLVALYQPVSGVVFVLDGVLIGAGDNRFLAVASIATTGVFVVCAYGARAAGWGLTGLWIAIGAFMVARLVALGVRARTGAWTVTGARR
ncbi:MAG: MATE family efflux transporter [Actinobacteria bacterium]|nr:MATE family efflux transporter [Actinomycetota bacterium]